MIFILTLVISVETASEVVLAMGEFPSQEACEQYATFHAQEIVTQSPQVEHVLFDCKPVDGIITIPMGGSL